MSQLSLIRKDNGLLALTFSDGRCSVTAELFQTALLEPFAAGLKGFPTSLQHIAEFTQEADAEHGDAIRLKLFCIDSGGHVALELFVESAVVLKGNPRKSAATLYLATEPIFVAKFASQLKKLLKNEADVATLDGAES
jgi:hypothetical protein